MALKSLKVALVQILGKLPGQTLSDLTKEIDALSNGDKAWYADAVETAYPGITIKREAMAEEAAA